MSRWLGIALAALLAVAFAPAGSAPVAAAVRPASLTAAVQWLRTQQNDDGGFGMPRSSGGVTTDAVLALAAAGGDISTMRQSGRSVMEYLTGIAPEYSQTPVGAAKLALAARAAGLDARAFGGVDLLAAIAPLDPHGQYGQGLFEHAYAVLALAGAGAPIGDKALARITDSQISDGAWGFAGPGEPGQGDTNTTALVIQALVAMGEADSPALARARAYLARSLAPGGGFVYAPGQEIPPAADANSTALVIQALLALDEAPDAPAWGASLDRLVAFQNASGAFRWRDDQPADNLLATVQALPALAQMHFPFGADDATGTRARRAAARPVAAFTSTAERAYFPESGHTLAHGFKHAWEERGGWEIFGLPLTEEFSELNPDNGQVYTVQYFERARFEYHPEHQGTPFETQLGLLGRQASAGRDEPAFARIARAPAADCVYFAETGHAACGPFLVVWRERGGLPIFGLPLSEPYQEGAAQVQYFERARFEYTAGAMKWGLLGRELLYRPRLATAR